MDATLGEIAMTLGGQLSDPTASERRVRAIRSLASAGPEDLSFFRDPKYLAAAKASKAAAIICDVAFEGAPCPLVVVEDAGLASSYLLSIERDVQSPPPPAGVHPAAVVDPTAQLGENVSVAPLAVIEAGARIGAGSRIGAHAFVGRNAILGDECTLHPGSMVLHSAVVGARCTLWPYAVIGRDGFGFLQREGKHHRVPQVGGVIVGDDVELGAWSSIDRGAIDPTIVGSGTKIDSHCHVAHNCKLGENVILVGYARMGGSAVIGNNAILAQDGAVGERRTVGDGGIVASGAKVLYEDVKPGEIVLGCPSRPALLQKRIEVLWARLPELFNDVRDLKKKLAKLAGA